MSLTLGVYDPFSELERFFDDAFLTRFSGGNANANREVAARQPFRPKMDIREGENDTVTATFELPGLKKEDVNIQLHNNRLTVSGETNVSSDREQDGYSVRERSFGKFERSLRLGQGIKEEDIKANMQDGVLTVTFPKTPAEQAPKRISVL
ncbi:small heat shock protein [Coniophora puteana RWD-64-598 SS2]|uniref:Small heat shock protein n=1 Tax=Coniophora puteana (strain RWD-64-598) TaxID=741705 RepID=A0A5M3MCQ3_CONPW|nr:small heat shock protein [Coniophora puteana RWD-64-598 SS2]EIW76415.1 small heat shock protein [Coniophora puteana RWD-64-598 SS2]